MLRNAHTSNAFGRYNIVRPQMVSDQVDVPAYIPQPSYSQSSIPENEPETPEIKDAFQIESMRHSCKLASSILREVGSIIKVYYFAHLKYYSLLTSYQIICAQK